MIITIITIILVLSIVIIVHELGHFFAAKKMGVTVEEFGIGYPPRIYGFKKGKTIYSINWIPFGGFVKIKGEDRGDTKIEADSFQAKKIWQRCLILLGGVLMNGFLTFALITTGFFIGIPSTINANLDPSAHVKDMKIQIVEISENTPAAEAGLEVGDTIVSIDGHRFQNSEEVRAYNRDKIGETVILEIKRGKELIKKEIIPQAIDETGEGKLGVFLVETAIVSYPWYLALWMGIKTTFQFIWLIIVALFSIFKNLILTQPVSLDVVGPVGIAALTSQIVDLGFYYVIQFVAIISIGLAAAQLIPFPALDGGRILFLIIEKIRKKAISSRTEGIIHTVGYYLLILLLIFISIHDVQRFDILGKISSFFQR